MRDIAGVVVASDPGREVVCSGVVSNVSQTDVTVAFDEGRDALDGDDGRTFHLLKLANDVTYRRLRRTLEKLSKDKEVRYSSLVEVLFGTSTPGENAESSSTPPLDFYNDNLDDSQREAVRFSLRQRELAVIHGPPGTGKTTTLVEVIQQCAKQGAKSAASKNKAKDAYYKVQGKLSELRKELKERERKAMGRVLTNADVVLSTLTSASDDGPLRNLPRSHFEVAVVDECSQALEAACWMALLRAPKCILAGDHLQLPPTIVSETAAKEGLAVTLMERALILYGDSIKRMLNMQYRMHGAIMKWSSNRLYEGRLVAHSSVASHLLRDLPGVEDNDDTATPLLLIDTASCSMTELDTPDDESKGNEGEADLVAIHVERLISSGVDASSIAVISPYNLQVELIRLRLSSRHPGLEVRSVDGFQGREKEAVVMSLVRSNDAGNVGFLAEDRRINVAVTRARRHVAVICDTVTVSRHDFLKSLVDYLSSEGEVRSAREYSSDRTCADPTCQEKLHTVLAGTGGPCPFCKRGYCFKHALPEAHGCGDEARAHARAAWLKSRGGTVAPPRLRPDKKAQVRKELSKQLAKMADSRKRQTKK
ncbi:DNA-binding protein Smubp-2, putative [Ixodes scapularis]|uniref:DNA helicase n=1 Tax=Ixodes scapularis TaxID=6945 RepID=B7Q747_IXOSC|nr:DNA-binding protein Smubp-2, putative [Ixodes scapularis]|eukprot:XP_002412098.1 DNA-binding protein Smubp-2, putative [Ixodes scapularis]